MAKKTKKEVKKPIDFNIDFEKIVKDSTIAYPTVTKGMTFKVSKIQMDEDFLWTLFLKFSEYFTTIDIHYNIVIAPSPEYFQDNIDAQIRRLQDVVNDPQTSLDIEDEKDPKYTLDRLLNDINSTIGNWNKRVEEVGIVNMSGSLEKYERKSETKDMSFIISADAVDFWKNRYKKFENYVICLEKSDTSYSYSQFKKELVSFEPKDFAKK